MIDSKIEDKEAELARADLVNTKGFFILPGELFDIDLDDPVQSYLTRWQIPESKYQASDVTFRRLLSHTAGISVAEYAGYPPDIGLPTLEQSLLGNPSSIYSKYNKT